MRREELEEYLLSREVIGEDVFDRDCENIIFLLNNCDMSVTKSRFFVDINCADLTRNLRMARGRAFDTEINARHQAALYTLSYTANRDFGHTSAEWYSIISLGIFGIRKRIDEYAQKYGKSAERAGFHTALGRVYDAVLRFIARAAEVAAASGDERMARGLTHLCTSAPTNLYEAMQTTVIWYTLQQYFDSTILRTLGRLDSLFYPFYKNEDKAQREALLDEYIREIDGIKADANIPFAICGTDEHGNSLTNELSYDILDAYVRSGATDTKMHILCSANTPTDLIERAFRAIRDGRNSIVFMCDERIITSLQKLGASYPDAVDYHVVGCYECGARGELSCSCNARVNIPKALELALNDGCDMLTGERVGLSRVAPMCSFSDVYSEFKRQLTYLASCAMDMTDEHEKNYRYVHSSPIMSANYVSALERGADLYCDYGARYNNSSLNALGLATAADSLYAIKEMVFEREVVTLDELIGILKSNWEGREPLRQTVKNRFKKFGQGEVEVDSIAADIVNTLYDTVGVRENVKGGKYRLGLFSIDWRVDFGERTAASADSRLAHEPLSQNTSATFGADKHGASAHLCSVCAIDTEKTPNATIVDIDLHSSAVRGDNGIKVLTAALRTYFELGGFAVHYNVLDTDTLRDAKAHPEKYPNLQVRLCGWNVLFSTLDDRAKDEFIARSEK